MIQLTRRDAMKVAAAGLFLPAVMSRKSMATPKRLGLSPKGSPFPWSREHIVVMSGCRVGCISLINQVNADVFLGCQPGTLLGVGANWGGTEGGLLTMRWRFLEAPTWNVRVVVRPASGAREVTVCRSFQAFPSMPMQPVFDSVTRDCQMWEWTVDGKVVLQWDRPGTIRQKPYMGDEDGSNEQGCPCWPGPCTPERDGCLGAVPRNARPRDCPVSRQVPSTKDEDGSDD